MAEFTHLHLHTDYSLLDGACDVEKLIAHVDRIGQKSVAMTDHGNIYGAVHFFNAAKAKGIKPILGCELYVCKKEDHRADPQGDDYNHLLVLAENEEGYRNLIRITSEASLHGFYRKPRVSKNFLAEHSKGLIGFSGCLAGELCENLMAGKYEAARKAAAAQYQDIFGTRQLLPRNSGPGPRSWKRRSTPISSAWKKNSTSRWSPPTTRTTSAATTPTRTTCCSACRPARRSTTPNRFKFDSDQFFVKSADEMARLFPHSPGSGQPHHGDSPSAATSSCNKVDNPFPEFAVPPGHTIDSYFEEVCRAGLSRSASRPPSGT